MVLEELVETRKVIAELEETQVMLVQVANRNGDDECKGETGRVVGIGGDKEGDGGSRRDTSGVGNNGCDTSGDGKGKEDEGYVLRIDGDTEQLCRSKGDTVSECISRADKNDEAQNGVGSGYTGQFLNNDVLESIIKITLKSFPFMRTSLRGVNTFFRETVDKIGLLLRVRLTPTVLPFK